MMRYELSLAGSLLNSLCDHFEANSMRAFFAFILLFLHFKMAFPVIILRVQYGLQIQYNTLALPILPSFACCLLVVSALLPIQTMTARIV